jgi:hypothetical protein
MNRASVSRVRWAQVLFFMICTGAATGFLISTADENCSRAKGDPEGSVIAASLGTGHQASGFWSNNG